MVFFYLECSFADLPKQPTYVDFNVSHAIAHYSVVVRWQPPSYDGGADIRTYNIMLFYDNEILMSESLDRHTLEISNLSYNANYLVTVSAENCIGPGNISSLNFSQGSYNVATH